MKYLWKTSKKTTNLLLRPLSVFPLFEKRRTKRKEILKNWGWGNQKGRRFSERKAKAHLLMLNSKSEKNKNEDSERQISMISLKICLQQQT